MLPVATAVTIDPTPPIPVVTDNPSLSAPAGAASQAPAFATPSAITWNNLPVNSDISFAGSYIHIHNRLATGMMRKIALENSYPGKPAARELRVAYCYGGYSLGKTHLMHAAANEVMTRLGCDSSSLAFFSAANFVQQIQKYTETRQQETFLDAVATAKALFVDDIHLLAGNEATQEALVMLSDRFESADKPRFFTSLVSPDALQNFSLRLVKRFQWAMIVELEKIDRAQRGNILAARMETLNLQSSEAIIQYLATLELDNIREIDALLNKISNFSSIMNQEITLDFIRRITQPAHPEIRRTITIQDIELFIRERFNISHDDMLSPKRSRNIAFPRQIAMYLTHEYTHTSMEAIGDYYGGRDHSTVKHACEKIKSCHQSDPVVKSLLEHFQQTFC